MGNLSMHTSWEVVASNVPLGPEFEKLLANFTWVDGQVSVKDGGHAGPNMREKIIAALSSIKDILAMDVGEEHEEQWSKRWSMFLKLRLVCMTLSEMDDQYGQDTIQLFEAGRLALETMDDCNMSLILQAVQVH